MERRQQVEGLRLALAEATAQLQAACRPVHRDMLRQRIAALEASLASLAEPVRPAAAEAIGPAPRLQPPGLPAMLRQPRIAFWPDPSPRHR